ncbi:MAG: signal peptidase II [Elusimicrobiales bacterium]|jgi:signal peptidase II|nr:signal peptidase II [Elusimicrobiales bacterium]
MVKDKREITGLAVIILVFFVDRLTKFVILNNLSLHHCSVIGNLLRFEYTRNTGIAFGFMKGHNVFFFLFNTVLLLFLFFIRRKFKDSYSFIGINFVIGGALGNLVDRIKYNYVVDFIDLSFFPAIFNIADFSITVGAVLILFSSLREEKCVN